MDERLLFFTGVLCLGIAAQWLAWRMRLPSILLLLAFGFAAGLFYDQSGVVDEDTLYALVGLSVGVILLEGGFTLKIAELREAGGAVLRLISIGVLVSWGLTAVAAKFLAGFSWPVAVLFGAILVVTGPTVIGPLLRSVKPTRRVNTVLKWEGIVIDPVGAVLAVLVFGVLFGAGHGDGTHGEGAGLAGAGWSLLKTLLVGCGFGWAAAMALAFVLARHWVPDFLQSAVILAAALALFTLSNQLQHESGLLTVTVLGVGLANQERAKIRHVIEFKENLRTLLISCLFIVLGARIGWEDLVSVWKEALLFLAALILVVRPLSVLLSTLGSKGLGWREKLFLSFMAPRGIVAAAVSSVFALELANTGGEYAGESDRLVSVAYTVIVGTVAFYGIFAGPLARRLGLAVANPQGVLFVGIRKWSIEAARAIQKAGFRVLMIDTNYEATRRARMDGIQALNANVLSDYVTEEIDLSGIGSLVAVTPNDQVNALACLSLGHSLGNSHTYQFKPADLEDRSGRKSSSAELTGRFVGKGEPTTRDVANLEERGAVVKCTKLNETFDYEDFQQHNGEDCLILFIIRESGSLVVYTEGTFEPGKGDSLISLARQNDPGKIRADSGDPRPDAKLP